MKFVFLKLVFLTAVNQPVVNFDPSVKVIEPQVSSMELDFSIPMTLEEQLEMQLLIDSQA